MNVHEADGARILGLVLGTFVLGLANLFAGIEWGDSRAAKKLRYFRIASAIVWFFFAGPGAFVFLCWIWTN